MQKKRFSLTFTFSPEADFAADVREFGECRIPPRKNGTPSVVKKSGWQAPV